MNIDFITEFMKTKWKYLITAEGGGPGSSSVWNIDVACISDGLYGWRASGGEQDPDVDPNLPIDTGTAKSILECLTENTPWDQEDEMRESLIKLAKEDPKFSPFLAALNTDEAQDEDGNISGNALRPVLIVVTNWPSGTTAQKFGGALQAALGATQGQMVLVQMEPERIFRVETKVSEFDFRKAMASKDVPSRGSILFLEIPTH